MNHFAFIIHPMDAADVARKYPFASRLPAGLVEALLRFMPTVVASHITGVRSEHAEVEGWFMGLTLTTRQIMNLPERYVLRRIIDCGKKAQALGAQVLGLGAFTSVVGDAGVTVAKALDIPVTTGNSYTVAMALEGTREAARLMGHDMKAAAVAVVGATGSIGGACARILARETSDLTLVGRNIDRLDDQARQILDDTGLACHITTEVRAAVTRADVVVTVSSAAGTIIGPEDLRPGAVVCDVARPRDVARQVAEKRPDVLVIDGAVVAVPGEPQFNINFGLPPGLALGCMAETMTLALEGRFESFTLGRDLTVAQVDEISAMAARHGFRLGGLRSFDRAVSPEQIAAVQRAARAAGA